jgi:hypothetical protein
MFCWPPSSRANVSPNMGRIRDPVSSSVHSLRSPHQVPKSEYYSACDPWYPPIESPIFPELTSSDNRINRDPKQTNPPLANSHSAFTFDPHISRDREDLSTKTCASCSHGIIMQYYNRIQNLSHQWRDGHSREPSFFRSLKNFCATANLAFSQCWAPCCGTFIRTFTGFG